MNRSLLLASVALAATGAAVLTPAAVQAQTVAASSDGYADATAAYAAMNAGRPADAVPPAARAVNAAPDNLDWRLLLVDALIGSGDDATALSVLQPVAGSWDHRVQTRRAETARRTGDLRQAAEAYGLAAPLAPTAESRAYLARARVQALVELGRTGEARTVLREAHASGMLPGNAPLDFAYAAVSTGEDRLAVQGFAAADRAEPLKGAQALDAAYAARRAGQDPEAITWLEQGARTLPAEQLTPQRRHEIGRELQTLEHRFGGTATVSVGPADSATTLVNGGGDEVTQVGGEVWARVGGDNNGRPVQVFARAYQTVDADTGPTGGESTQGWVGVRWKPFTETNLSLEASRLIAVGDAARDDTMLRAAWSADVGSDLRYDRDSWPSAHVYVDVARLLEDEQTYAVADANLGWTWVASESRRDTVTAGVGVRADYDSLRAEEWAVAAGPRVAWRHWMGGDDLRAPGRYLDVSLGYYAPIGDGPRDEGVVAAVTFGF
ncbi:NfrA family protein [Brevundimonas sp.]|uniref:NfrA family protein n=1 Tax=Brevundimonas sp. TaxID=1871086 RepID=UPI003F6FEB3F